MYKSISRIFSIFLLLFLTYTSFAQKVKEVNLTDSTRLSKVSESVKSKVDTKLDSSVQKAETHIDHINTVVVGEQSSLREAIDSKNLLTEDTTYNNNDVKREATDAVEETIAHEKEAARKKVDNVFEGEGITNENVSEKVKSLLEDESFSEKALEQQVSDLRDKDVTAKAGDILSNKDSLLSGVRMDDPLSSAKTIFSEKDLKFAYDSLLKNVDWNVLNAMLRDPSSVSDAALVEAVFVKFPALTNVSKARQDSQILSAMANGTDPMRTLSSLAAVHLHDFSRMEVSDTLIKQLPALKGRKLDAKYLEFSKKYLDKLDSLLKVNWKQDGFKLQEKNLSEFKEAILKKRRGFLDKLYFEGIIGLFNGAWNDSINLFQLSPSLGYHLTNHFSLGLGPTIVLQEQKKNINVILGARSFAKYELLKYNFYLQVEDNISFPRTDRTAIEERTIDTQHALMGGGGYLLPLSKKLSLNICLLYRFPGGSDPLLNGSSPWIYRIGISSTRIKR